MKPSFLGHERPLLTTMVIGETAEHVIRLMRNARCQGAEAFGFQLEWLHPELHTSDVYRRLFDEAQGRPTYATYYRGAKNEGRLTDEQLANELLTIADCGATLCDVIGDLYAEGHPDQLTDDPVAIEKQMKLIDALHEKGTEVLISSHVCRFTPAERVLEMALEQKRRGADIIKIVTAADTMEEQIENLRTTDLLKRELGAPFLFLSGGECSIHRRLGMKLGCCMSLCVWEHDHISAAVQPLLSTMKTVRDCIDF